MKNTNTPEKKDGPILTGREKATIAAAQGGNRNHTEKPEIDLQSWAALGGKPSRDRRQKKSWRRQGGGK